ncbi:3-keto-5-aminohexanoate cleavage protein [Mesorhizobium sp.]|uniref:3-keto-5-aminohexanoate cleavage protein n=1 Tax=Mesorhizobium sp. TaxID=1871066 RepID=UPI0025C5A31D|nr:3-keto-5-aminohexanoate cleavage protein [Mesorhizobium sp.]
MGAGAAIVHVHVRDPATGAAAYDVDLFKEASDRIRQSSVDVILNLTCGGNARFVPDPEDETRRAWHDGGAARESICANIEECRPDIASLDGTTSNQGDGGDEYVYLNTPMWPSPLATAAQITLASRHDRQRRQACGERPPGHRGCSDGNGTWRVSAKPTPSGAA